MPVKAQEQPETDVPKSFVIRSGKVTKAVHQLVLDVRRVMEPNTAIRLKERTNNKLKDFISMAGPLGVSHFMIFAKTEAGTNLRVCKTPQGPTLTFRVTQFSLMRDVLSAQGHARSPGTEYQTAPLLVMNNFSASENHLKLTTTMFQNMFPALNVQKMNIKECRRVVMLNYDKETDMVSFRHYYIFTKPVGVSRQMKKILTSNAATADIPNLSKFADISEYVLRDLSGAASDTEDEGTANGTGQQQQVVTLPQNYLGKNNKQNQQRAIKLIEIGPRMEMKLLKVEQGLCSGEVLYHSYITKTKDELDAVKLLREQKLSEKAERRRQQEENVKRKEGDKEAHKQRCIGGQQKSADDGDNAEEVEEIIEENENDTLDAADEEDVAFDSDVYQDETDDELVDSEAESSNDFESAAPSKKVKTK